MKTSQLSLAFFLETCTSNNNNQDSGISTCMRVWFHEIRCKLFQKGFEVANYDTEN